MSAIELTWPGGHHAFALPLGMLRALQEAVDAGPEELLIRLRSGAWKVDDVVQILRWGLVGGSGMTPGDAGRLVSNTIDGAPLARFKLTALTLMVHALLGVEDDPVGEGKGVETSAPESGDSVKSTETGPSSDLRPNRSTT